MKNRHLHISNIRIARISRDQKLGGQILEILEILEILDILESLEMKETLWNIQGLERFQLGSTIYINIYTNWL